MKKLAFLLSLCLILASLAGCCCLSLTPDQSYTPSATLPAPRPTEPPVEMPTELPTEPPTEAPTEPPETEPSVYDYCGVFRGEQNIYLEMRPSGSSAIYLYYEQCTNNATRIATIEKSFQLSDILDNRIMLDYMDSWGNSGTMTLEFSGDIITCTIEELQRGDGAFYGVAPGVKLLTRSE